MGEAGADGEWHKSARPSLCLALLRTGTAQNERHAVVPLVARKVVEWPSVLRERERRRPRTGKRLWVVDGVLVVQRHKTIKKFFASSK